MSSFANPSREVSNHTLSFIVQEFLATTSFDVALIVLTSAAYLSPPDSIAV